MELRYSIHYHEAVVKQDIPRLSKGQKQRVKKAIESKLTSAPETFGAPLRRSLKGYRKLRVGDYRIVFRIQGKKVLIFIIAHRSVIYKQVNKRMV